jgi:DNA adenine methylase
MSRTASPLRYPGGKSALEGMVTSIICENGLLGGTYAEPFAGGCGLALSLLFSSVVREIHLNDIDPAISALWRAILDDTDALCGLIQSTPVTIDEWHGQRDNYRCSGRGDATKFGFSTLFLNRTNRSGIIKGAGVIGGLRQTGNYLLDCRFNKDDLVKRVRRIAKYRSRIHFTSMDASEFLRGIGDRLPRDTLLMADPPYFGKGADLYTSHYSESDHAVLAQAILNVDLPWITTYDNCPEISTLYRSRRQFAFDIQYSAQTKRLGCELLIVSKGLRLPKDIGLRAIHRAR